MRIPGAEPRRLKTEIAPKPAAPTGGTQANTVKTTKSTPTATGTSGVSSFTAAPARAKVDLLDPALQDARPYLAAMDAAAAFGLEGDEAKAFIDTLRAEFERNPEALNTFENSVGWLDFYSDGVVNDNGGTDRSSLTDQLEQVQYLFGRDFPDLASRYGIDNTTVDDINVGYYAAA